MFALKDVSKKDGFGTEKILARAGEDGETAR